MKENNIIQFPTDRIKKEIASPSKDGDLETRIVKELTFEQEKNFIMKCAWVVEILYNLKQNQPNTIKRENVQIRRDMVRGSSPEFLEDIIMEADELKISKDPSYYEAVTDEIYDRKLHRSKRK